MKRGQTDAILGSGGTEERPQSGAQSDPWGQDEALGLKGAPDHRRIQSHMEARPRMAQLCVLVGEPERGTELCPNDGLAGGSSCVILSGGVRLRPKFLGSDRQNWLKAHSPPLFFLL